MRDHCRGTRATRGVLVASSALLALGPGPQASLRALSDPTAADPTAPVVALAALLAWACAAALLLAAAVTAGSALPGAAGRALQVVAAGLLPRALRRALALALGVGVVLTPAGPAGAAATPAPAPAPAAAASTVPSLDRPVAPPPATAAPAPARARARGRAVVVRPGDCLWSLAEQHLGPAATPARVAEAWPAWWSANRDVVGDDPDLLLPGTRLVPPPRP